MSAHHREHPFHWALVACALLAVAVMATGCGALGPAQESGPPRPAAAAARITIVRASVQVKSDAPMTQVSAICPRDTQMIGGGFAATNVFEYDALVTASYPDPHDNGLRTWTAIAGSSSSFTLSAEAYCLRQGLDLQISLHMEADGRVAICAGGTLPLSAGFNGGASYVLCSGRDNHTVSGAPVTFNPQSSSHSYYPGGATLPCPGDTLALGGVISAGGGRLLASYSAGQPFTHWIIVLGGDWNVTASATCVTIIE